MAEQSEHEQSNKNRLEINQALITFSFFCAGLHRKWEVKQTNRTPCDLEEMKRVSLCKHGVSTGSHASRITPIKYQGVETHTQRAPSLEYDFVTSLEVPVLHNIYFSCLILTEIIFKIEKEVYFHFVFH